MSRTRRFLGGLSLGYANQLLVVLVGFWLTPFLLHRLGQLEYGLSLVVMQLLGYLSLADLGVVALLPREVAYSVGRAGSVEQANDLRSVLGNTTRLVLYQTPLVIVACAVLWVALPADWSQLRWPLLPLVVAFSLTFPARVPGAVLLGIQDLTWLGMLRTATYLLGIGITVALVLRGWGVEAITLSWLATYLVSMLASWVRLKRRFPSALPAQLPALDRSTAWAQLGRGMWLSVGNVAQLLLGGSDLLLLGAIAGPAAVVPLACTAKLVNILAQQPLALLHTAGPGLSELKVAAPERMLTVSSVLSQIMLILSGGVFCMVLVVNQGFVRWWIGPDQYGGFEITLALLVLMVLRHWNTTAIFALVCFGRERRMSVTMLIEGLVTIGCSAALIAKLGAVGAPLGAIAGITLVSIPGNLKAIAEESKVSAFAFVATLWPWLWRFLILATGTVLLALSWSPATLVEILLTAGGVGTGYGLLMFPLVLRPPLGPYVRPLLAWPWKRAG